MAAADTVGLVLAAGAGSRYGRPKILVRGWLETAVDALREGGCSEVAVVTGAARPQLPAGVREIHCDRWALGLGASLRAGLSALDGEVRRVVVHVVDCPDIGPDVVARVLDGAGDRLARATYGGRPGHPVVLPRAHLAPLLGTLQDDDGAGPYLRVHEHLAVECGDLASGQDIDTPRPDGDAPAPPIRTVEQ
jgi:molybdenum cofactor cytidylyltransferase